MICNIFKFIIPVVSSECEGTVSTPPSTCQNWDIDEFGETNNCEIENHSGLPWDIQKLGRLAIGETRSFSQRTIYGLKPEQLYDVTITLRALMTESIPFFTEAYNLILTIGNNSSNIGTIKIFSNENEYVTDTFSMLSDKDGQISIKMSSTSSNFQVDTISGICTI